VTGLVVGAAVVGVDAGLVGRLVGAGRPVRVGAGLAGLGVGRSAVARGVGTDDARAVGEVVGVGAVGVVVGVATPGVGVGVDDRPGSTSSGARNEVVGLGAATGAPR